MRHNSAKAAADFRTGILDAAGIDKFLVVACPRSDAERRMPDLSLALFQPDIPQNTGAILRLAACLGVTVDLIEPAGFLISDARLRRAGLDYAARARLRRHADWGAFRAAAAGGRRVVLLTTRGDVPLHAFRFAADDVLLLGRESAGVPDAVHAAAAARLVIPLQPGSRSLNVALAAAMAVGEALRQTGGLPAGPVPHPGSDPWPT